MGDVVDIEIYKKSKDIESDYLEFLSHVNKYISTPTTVGELARAFYLSLRYLQGTVNAMGILSMISPVPTTEFEEMKQMVTSYLNQLSEDVQKY